LDAKIRAYCSLVSRFGNADFGRSWWRVSFLGGFLLSAEGGTVDDGIFIMGELKALSAVMKVFGCGG
jgi:hypothetical protein